MKTTLVINIFGGPGAGKTVAAWDIASNLKKLGYVAEYVPEYAKELVWEEDYETLDGSTENQFKLFEVQRHRVDRLMGKVDFVVTDSPAILGAQYISGGDEHFNQVALKDFNSRNNFNLVVKRGDYFEEEGRLQNEEEAKRLDTSIEEFLQQHSIYYGVYSHAAIPIAISNIQATLHRLRKKGAL